jgi:Phage tail lysozyme
MDMQTRLFQEFVERGFTPAQAWGAVANLQAESGLDPGINEINPVVEGSRGGFGLNQWTGPRRRAFEAYMAERGLPLDDVEGQMDFTFHEFGTTEQAAYDKIRAAETPEEAAYAYSKAFLRPGHDNTDYRMRTAAGMAGGEYNPVPMMGSDGGPDRQYAALSEEEEDPYKPPPIFAKQHAALIDKLGGDHKRVSRLGDALSLLGQSMMA